VVAIVGWTIFAIAAAIALAAVIPGNDALMAALLTGSAGAFLTIRRLRRHQAPGATTKLIADSDQQAPEPSRAVQVGEPGIDEAASSTNVALNPLALEAQRALALRRPSAVSPPATSLVTPRAIWSRRLVGALAGVLMTFLVFLPAGTPDAAELTFALSMFTILGGLIVGWGLRSGGSPRLILAGEVILGVGIGAAVGFALVFIVPLL
jgi:hypothetical protein